MKKIPTLFEREFEGHKIVRTTPNVTPGLEWVLEGEGFATVKYDGAAAAIIDGVFYKRYDAKKGKTPPDGAIPCGDPDPVTGHWPHWVPVDFQAPQDKHFVEAYKSSGGATLIDWTYEVCGPSFRKNPHHFKYNCLIPHGTEVLTVGRSYEEIRDYLQHTPIEGIVFWKDGEPCCKIKRTDFGFQWPI